MKEFHGSLPSSFQIYEEGSQDTYQREVLKDYLQEKTGRPVFIKGNVYQAMPPERVEIVARRMVRLRIKDPQRGTGSQMAFDLEVNYERERVRDPQWNLFGILYEGVLYQQLLRDLVLEGELNDQDCNILLTNQLIGTWDGHDRRYHIRTILFGLPHLISLPGLVMGPAKPREFYLKRQTGIPVQFLNEEFKGRFLEHGDSRMTEVLKGYLMQAFFYQLLEAPFCEDPDCRLYNAHWQEEMLHAQLNGKYEFCPRHEEVLQEIKGGQSKGFS